MTATTADINSGLEGVVVAATAISDVQGKKGDLSYRGKSIDHWVQQDFSTAAAAVIDWPNLAIDEEMAGLLYKCCLLYTSPSPRDLSTSRMPSSA